MSGSSSSSSGSLLALLDRLGQPDFIFLGQQRILTNVCEVQPYEILFVPLDALLGQGNLPLVCEPAAPLETQANGRNGDSIGMSIVLV